MKLKIFSKLFNFCKFSTLNCFVPGSVVLQRITTIALTDTQSFRFVHNRNMNISTISNESL